jgi:hypothetical protein
MGIGRAIIFPAVLALGVAGAIMAGPVATVTATHAPIAHVQVYAAPSGTHTFFHT